MRLEARVESLYVGDQAGLEKTPQELLIVTLEGIQGDKHAGFTRLVNSRTPEYPKATPIRNDRQWSAVSIEELKEIAQRMGIPTIDSGWVGANLALSGIPNLTQLPRGTKLHFPEQAVLLVESENLPCIGPGEVIAQKYPQLNLKASLFPKAAYGKRGLVGVVERPGIIKLQDVVLVEVHQPRLYSFPPNLST